MQTRTPTKRSHLKERLNTINSFAQQGEDLIVQRIMERRLGIDPVSKTGFYVDIGAFNPISHSTTYLFYLSGWSGICADISRKTCEIFRATRPRDTVFHCAVTERDQKLAFRPAELMRLTNEAQLLDTSANQSTDAIDARSVNSLLEEVDRQERIDYINIDVEGAELSALRGFDFNKWAPKVITIEIHEKTAQDDLKHPIARFLTERGYVCVACAAIICVFVCEDDLT